MATTPPAVLAILALRPSLRSAPDELVKRVQSIRVRSAQDINGRSTAIADSNWRQRPVAHRESMNSRWRQSSGSLAPLRYTNTSPSTSDGSPRPTSRAPSFQNTSQPQTPVSPPARYVSRFHNGSKVGDDQILNTVILNKLNIFSVKTYDDVKQFLFQILGSDQKEFIREFTWLVFRKAATEDKFCALFAKLLCEIQKEYPVILEEMRNLHTTYLDIWDVTESVDVKVDRRCRLGYSQFLAELTALGVLESSTMQKTLETLKGCIEKCLSDSVHIETVEEYMDCLRQLCGSKVPKDVRIMIKELLVKDLEKWIGVQRDLVPGLSNKSRFACMDLKDHLTKASC